MRSPLVAPAPSTAREAARALLRTYVRLAVVEQRTDLEEWIRTGALGYHGPDYAASVRVSGHIDVTRLAGVPCTARFSLHKIWMELEDECRAGVVQHRLF